MNYLYVYTLYLYGLFARIDVAIVIAKIAKLNSIIFFCIFITHLEINFDKLSMFFVQRTKS